MKRICLVVLFTLLAACDRSPGDGAMPGMRRAGGMMRHVPGGVVDTAGLRDLAVPAEFQRGQELYQVNCAQCHGDAALGTAQGPPLVHIIYEPSHHADAAFLLATLRGVRAHHWAFGDMPPQPQVSREEMAEIVKYVRWLQREAGVY